MFGTVLGRRVISMLKLAIAVFLAALSSTTTYAQTNAGEKIQVLYVLTFQAALIDAHDVA